MKYFSVKDICIEVEAGRMIILDVREHYEFEICSVEALHIPMDELFNRLGDIPTDTMVAVMCRSGKRAEAVANILITEHDFKNIVVMDGGILELIEKCVPHLESY